MVADGRVGFCSAEENAEGPVQAYVAPATVGVAKEMVDPAQYGPVLVAVGVAGRAFTTTVVVPAKLVHPPTVTVTEYVPAIATVAAGRVGFCNADENAEGPVQAYVAPATVGVAKVMVDPAQYGPVFVAVGVAGKAFTTTVVVPAKLVQPETVTVTE